MKSSVKSNTKYYDYQQVFYGLTKTINRSSLGKYTNVPVQVCLIHLGTVIVGGWNAPGNGAENVVIALHIFLLWELLSQIIGQIGLFV
jgi:hypothetical protein